MSAIAFRNRVLNFWFVNRWIVPDKPPAKSTPVEQSDLSRWFRSSKEFDQQIKEQFEADLPRLMNDEYRYPNDLNDPEHLLACIIALDQFPRNIYRQDPRAFAYDSKARELSELLINHQGDKQLPYIERAFSYLPFEHSENLDDQNRAVKYFQELYHDAANDSTSKEGVLNFLKQFIAASEQHRGVIQQFGRFPHRNAILNRSSLESEEQYLNSGGARFGQQKLTIGRNLIRVFFVLDHSKMPTARDDQPDFRDAFSLFDDRGDDKIPKQLFGEVVRALGLNPTEAQIKGTIQNLKTDRISFEEFLPLYESLAKKKDNHMSEGELIEGLKVFDKEQNGSISSAELRHLLTNLGERLSDEEVEQLLSGFEDKNGLINYEDWIRKLLRH